MSEGSSPDRRRADVGLVCALPIEIAPFLTRLDRHRKYIGETFTFRGGFLTECRVAIVEAGLGPARAARATQALIDGHDPRWIVSCGFAGSLSPELQIGDIFIPESIRYAAWGQVEAALGQPPASDGPASSAESAGTSTTWDEIHTPSGMSHAPRERRHVGTLVTTDRMLTLVTQKRQLGGLVGAGAVDMEAHAVAQVCRERKRRFLGIRVISDDLTEDIPAEATALVGPTGALRWGATFGTLLQKPGSMSRLWKLRSRATAAADNLATFLTGVVDQLYDTVDE